MSDPSCAIIACEDGWFTTGTALSPQKTVTGELVFNTAMTGYQEVMTDPSYAGQFIVFTAPHIGIVGTNDIDIESHRIHAKGIICHSLSKTYSNFRSRRSLYAFIEQQNIMCIEGIDTRALTHHIRQKGCLKACLTTNLSPEQAIEEARKSPDISETCWADHVCVPGTTPWSQTTQWPKKKPQDIACHIIVVDFGVKQNILRLLRDQGVRVTCVPRHTPLDEIRTLAPDGIILSNGPGDPAHIPGAIEQVKDILSLKKTNVWHLSWSPITWYRIGRTNHKNAPWSSWCEPSRTRSEHR